MKITWNLNEIFIVDRVKVIKMECELTNVNQFEAPSHNMPNQKNSFFKMAYRSR
jgi:hypothetical protein